jgi:hypothetical protein
VSLRCKFHIYTLRYRYWGALRAQVRVSINASPLSVPVCLRYSSQSRNLPSNPQTFTSALNNCTIEMPRPQRAAAAKARSKLIDFPESSEASSSDEAAKTKVVEHKSVEVRETITAKEKLNASATVTKVGKTVKTTVRLKPKAGVKRKAGEDNDNDSNGDNEGQKSTTQKKVRASTKKNPPTMIPAVARTVGIKMLVGAHVSMAKGLEEPLLLELSRSFTNISFYSRKNRGPECYHKLQQHWWKRIRLISQVTEEMGEPRHERI